MSWRRGSIRVFGVAWLMVMPWWSLTESQAQELTVTAQITITRTGKNPGAAGDHADAVVWLRPLDKGSTGRPAAAAPRQKILQKEKKFLPRVLPVVVGSEVEFPNLDPFFHNVFSLYDGKKFDLGLYESGRSARVKFDRPGICYVFCNIHPEMSAVVVVLETPYHAVSDESGRVAISGVPAGRYLLSAWHPLRPDQQIEGFPREVQVSPGNTSLGTLQIPVGGSFAVPHKNKLGLEYEPSQPQGGLPY